MIYILFLWLILMLVNYEFKKNHSFSHVGYRYSLVSLDYKKSILKSLISPMQIVQIAPWKSKQDRNTYAHLPSGIPRMKQRVSKGLAYLSHFILSPTPESITELTEWEGCHYRNTILLFLKQVITNVCILLLPSHL